MPRQMKEGKLQCWVFRTESGPAGIRSVDLIYQKDFPALRLPKLVFGVNQEKASRFSHLLAKFKQSQCGLADLYVSGKALCDSFAGQKCGSKALFREL